MRTWIWINAQNTWRIGQNWLCIQPITNVIIDGRVCLDVVDRGMDIWTCRATFSMGGSEAIYTSLSLPLCGAVKDDKASAMNAMYLMTQASGANYYIGG